MRIALATCAGLPTWETDDRPLHDALHNLGVEVVLPVWDDPSIDWEGFDACLIRTTWDYQEKHEAYLEWIDRVDAATRLFNPASIVRWNTHKSYLRDLEARGVPVLPTVWCPRGETVNVGDVLAEQAWDAGFLKPAVGATARETLRFNRSPEALAEAQAHVDRMTAAEDMLLQPYQDTVETAGEFSAIFIDGVFTHDVRKTPVPGDYRVQDDFGGHDEPADLSADEIDRARAFVDAVEGDVLYARADFLRDASGALRLIEMELVEPSLFFRHGPAAAERLAKGLLRRLGA